MRFVVKDVQHRYLYVNRVWQESLGFSDKSVKNLIGKTALDIFPKWRANRYILEEREVMENGKVFDYEEYALNADGVIERWRTIKTAWVRDGTVVGYINMGTKLGLALEKKQDQLPQVVREMVKYACSGDSIDTIALQMGVSRRTMERRFKEIMNETPQQFRLKCKIAKAKQLLAKGWKVAEVANKCGFNDQSHFSKVFGKLVGMSPKKYQKGLDD